MARRGCVNSEDAGSPCKEDSQSSCCGGHAGCQSCWGHPDSPHVHHCCGVGSYPNAVEVAVRLLSGSLSSLYHPLCCYDLKVGSKDKVV